MWKRAVLVVAVLIAIAFLGGFMWEQLGRSKPNAITMKNTISLPEPNRTGDLPVENAIHQRRSIRNFKPEPLTINEISQLLWSGQGMTGHTGLRSAPSAGALYPLELYVVVRMVSELTPGVYHYLPESHRLTQVIAGDRHPQLTRAALDQQWIRAAPAVIVISAEYGRTTGKYGERGIRYVHMEVGFAAENIYLQAEALGLGTVFVGAFHDQEVKRILALPEKEEPLGLMPVGWR